MEFVLLLGGDDGSAASASELGRRTGLLAAWVFDLRASGIVLEGGSIDGQALRIRTVDGRMSVLDVPPGSDHVSSWLLVDVPDLEAAVAIARSCPETTHGEVRVLPVDPKAHIP